MLSAASYIGAYGALVRLWAPPDALAQLQDFIAGPLGDLRHTGTFAVQAAARVDGPTPYGMKLKKCDVVAIVRVWCRRGRLDDILDRVADLPGFNGAAIVFGDLNDPKTEVREVLRAHFSIRRKPELGTLPQVYYIV